MSKYKFTIVATEQNDDQSSVQWRLDNIVTNAVWTGKAFIENVNDNMIVSIAITNDRLLDDIPVNGISLIKYNIGKLVRYAVKTASKHPEWFVNENCTI